MSVFPDPRRAPADGPLARGGHLGPDVLVDAYTHGIFPWPLSDGSLYWWSPDPRAIIPLEGFHVSRSLRRTLRSGHLRHTVDRAFAQVVRACAVRPGEGTWLVPDMISAYTELHRRGIAHSVEVWQGGRLVGGVYGVAIGGTFSGESMFHRVDDASKVALFHLVGCLQAGRFSVLDVQMWTPHLASLGAVAIDRAVYLDLIRAVPPGIFPAPDGCG